MLKMPDRVFRTHVIGEQVTKDDLMIDDILLNPFSYEQKMVHAVLLDGKQHVLDSVGEYIALLESHGEMLCIKIEGMEKLSRKLWDFCNSAVNPPGESGPFSCHCFISPQDSPSFPDHTDPDGVLLYVVEGEKYINSGAYWHAIPAGQALYIPPGTVHRAVNRFDSVMLSIGFDKFIEEKL